MPSLECTAAPSSSSELLHARPCYARKVKTALGGCGGVRPALRCWPRRRLGAGARSAQPGRGRHVRRAQHGLCQQRRGAQGAAALSICYPCMYTAPLIVSSKAAMQVGRKHHPVVFHRIACLDLSARRHMKCACVLCAYARLSRARRPPAAEQRRSGPRLPLRLRLSGRMCWARIRGLRRRAGLAKPHPAFSAAAN